MAVTGSYQDWTTLPAGAPGQYITEAFKQATGAQAAFPTIAQLPGAVPGLNVPDLTANQNQLLQLLQTYGTGTPDLEQARQLLSGLTSGPIGSSPYTQQAMQAWQQQVAPSIEQNAALSGLAGSGAEAQALAQAQTSALVPLLQQEIATRQQAVGQYGQLGNEQIAQLTSVLQAQGLPYEVALAQAQAAYDKATKGFGIQADVQLGPLALLGSLLGRAGVQRGAGAPTGSDWTGGILAGALGGLAGGLGA